MEARVDFDINEAIKLFDSDPATIPAPEAPRALQECEDDPEALSSLALINSELNPVVDAVAESPDAITRSSVFDTLQFLLKCVPARPACASNKTTAHESDLTVQSRNSAQIPPAALGKILDLIVSALSTQADIVHADLEAEDQDAIPHHKTLLEMYAFLFRWTISAVETRALEKSASAPAARGRGKTGKSKAGSSKDGTWDAAAQLETALDRVSKVLKLKLGRIFVTTSERDTFVGLFTKPVYHILENEARVKNAAIRNHCFRVLCIAVKHHGHAYTAQTSINQCLTYFEHLSEPMAEFLHTLADAYDYSQLAEDVLKDISTKEYSATDLKGPKSVSTFLIKISELLPNLIIKQGALLNNLLDSEAYTLRCAMIEVCGNLINMLSKLSQDDRSEAHKRNIDIFFDVLEQRFLDINPYCRCRVMQVYVKLCDLPHMSSKQGRKRRQMAADFSEQSLRDKSSNVRRNAIKLLSKLVETHPFSAMYNGLLSTESWEQGLEGIDANIAALKPPEELQERAPGEVDESMLLDATQADAGTAKDPAEMNEEEQAALVVKLQKDAETVQELEKFNKARSFVRQALRFIEVINDAAEQVMQLLSSKNKSEVIEAMDFFTTIDAYKIANARLGIKRMLRLIWTKGNSDEGKGVQAHLIDCYKGLFFNAPPGCDTNQAANYITRGMISLTFDTTPAELISLEQLLSTMMKQGLVNSLVIEKLWAIYGYQKKDISMRQRRGAIIVLGMLALSSPDIIVQEMETCLRIGLGKFGHRDFGLARYTCVALRRISAPPGKQQAGEAQAPAVKLPNDHAVLVRLAAMCELESDSKDWFGVADQAISAIYVLSRHPDVLCSDIIRQVAKRVFSPKAPSRPTSSSGPKGDGSDPIDVDEEMPDAPALDAPQPKKQNSALALSQLVFIVGHVAIKQIVHLEICELEFKRRKAEKEKDKKAAPRKSLAPEPTPLKKGRKRGAAKDPTPAPEAEADDLDLMAGTNEDDFTDAIAHVRERELLFGPQSLLANFGPLVSDICANNTSYNHPTLQAQAALCLGKLMCVSQQYCEDNLNLLLNILERSQDAVVRSNLVIALGDMAVCFNHLVEQDTEFLYRRLNDSDPSVKRTCLQTLTFLILAGQVKVKGQLAEMAKCIEDSDKKITEMARQFFSELSTKDNAIYNQFVDMFSTLSADTALDEDAFKRIIKYLAGYIEKEKQAKQLSAKLASRLPRAENERQWRDIEYTLGFLQHKDEEIQKMLSEGFKVVQATA
ncbi:mitotic chromosome condensation [Ascochyta rabiei]|uniref:Condensin complex subunit 1 n=2 Tax=Didymella rabiei TaxID=5454 RepID=A0A163E4A5_DIDRA|nr:mitotic chromosome condensation [Ascochyta rabiei]